MYVTNEELRELKPLIVAVVGPTNEGKTSLLRTLTSDPNFGLVNAYNGTTVRAEIQKIFYKGVAEILQLVDTPGFQTSSEILELLLEDPEIEAQGGAFDLNDILRVIPQRDDDFQHDQRAWREVARCDAIVFVVNVVEDPNQSLLKNTLRLLKNVGKPVVVAYNNVHDLNSDVSSSSSSNERVAAALDAARPNYADFRKEWDETLRKNSFFLVQEYDAHRRSFANEIELFEKLAALAREPLTQRVLRLEIKERRARELRRLERSREILAELLVDVAAYYETETNVGLHEWKQKIERLKETLKRNVVQREHEAQLALLETWGFRVGVLDREMLIVDDDAQESDRVFGTGVKRNLKVGGGVGATVGAVVGGALDVATGGLSLGAGIALGGFLGGLIGGGGALAYNAKYDSKGKKLTVRPQKNAFNALLARGVELTLKLQTRGKALEDAVQAQVSSNLRAVEIPGVVRLLNEVASYGEYSKMNKVATSFGVDAWRRLPGMSILTKERKTREEMVQAIAEFLKQALPDVE